MRTIHSSTYGELEIDEEQIYRFDTEILGIAGIYEYGLMPLGDTPFFVLHALEEDVSFILLPAEQAVSEYSFKINQEVVELLGLKSGEDAGVMLIVNISGGELFVNMRAPLLFSPEIHKAHQFIITDQELPLRFPLQRRKEEA
ncbi:flagellar assembly protein FliW [Paenibacillus yonginensis]|uniref:Flagellar assembly factor FliW n=1 Tax=Paenibacillus yonginensis TaxID=1462996 RepID=A0A1B1N3S5_9BACL|nr:flagellar assembly protein FliW [Paenibacillus yonginensis]ANS76098.1 flagellar assembly protein FliW [Paenibacillus yonginensis]